MNPYTHDVLKMLAKNIFVFFFGFLLALSFLALFDATIWLPGLLVGAALWPLYLIWSEWPKEEDYEQEWFSPDGRQLGTRPVRRKKKEETEADKLKKSLLDD